MVAVARIMESVATAARLAEEATVRNKVDMAKAVDQKEGMVETTPTAKAEDMAVKAEVEAMARSRADTAAAAARVVTTVGAMRVGLEEETRTAKAGIHMVKVAAMANSLITAAQKGGRMGGGYGNSSGTSYGGGGYGGSNDFSGAAQHAAEHAGSSGDPNMFSQVMGNLQGRHQQLQNEGLDEQDAVQQHQQYYSGGGGGQQATSGSMGSAAAMQALKMFNGGGGSSSSGGSSGGSQNQFIGMAMAQASKLFDQQQSQGNVQQGHSKQDAVQSAAQMAMKMFMKSEMGGGGSSSGGGLMSLASKFFRRMPLSSSRVTARTSGGQFAPKSTRDPVVRSRPTQAATATRPQHYDHDHSIPDSEADESFDENGPPLKKRKLSIRHKQTTLDRHFASTPVQSDPPKPPVQVTVTQPHGQLVETLNGVRTTLDVDQDDLNNAAPAHRTPSRAALRPETKPIVKPPEKKEEKRTLRSHDEGPRLKSELATYFSNYEDVMFDAPKEQEFITLDTALYVTDDTQKAIPVHPSPLKAKESPSLISDGSVNVHPHPKTPQRSLSSHFNGCSPIDLDMLARNIPDHPEDPLDDERFLKSHRRAERKEKQLRNIEKERAMHEKVQLERLLDGLQGHDWLKVLGITGITDGEAKKYEAKRDYFIAEVQGLVDKFAQWKEQEKKQRLKKEAIAVREAESAEPEESQEDSDEPASSDIAASASRQLQQETLEAVQQQRSGFKIRLSKGKATSSSTPTPLTTPAPAKHALSLPPPPSEIPITSFYKKRHLRDSALSKTRHGRSVTAFGLPLPDMEYKDFKLPKEYFDQDLLRANARERRRRKRAMPRDSATEISIEFERRRGTPLKLRMDMDGFVGDVAVDVARYSVLRQRVDLDVDLATQSIKGSTEITVQPAARDVREIKLQCRQCKIGSVQVNGITAKYEYENPYKRARLQGETDVHQHRMLKERIKAALRPQPEAELSIALPPKVKIQEISRDAATQLPAYSGNAPVSVEKQEADAMAIAETPIVVAQAGPSYASIKIYIEFEVDDFRDGLHWVGCHEGDKRYPYVYTKVEPWAGSTSCIFPCVDDATSKCGWELRIRCSRTLGDAFKRQTVDSQQPNGMATQHAARAANSDVEMVNGVEHEQKEQSKDTANEPEHIIDLSDEDAALELAIVCIGDQVDDVADSEDETKHTVTFAIIEPVCARHIGFAVGPFERIDLSSVREASEEERLGQSAVKVEGFCLPTYADQVRNTCFPVTKSIDHFGVSYGSFPFSSYQVVFVDDLVYDHVAAAGLSICSSNLLFPEDVIDVLEPNTRKLVRAVAEQWAGVSVIPKEPRDSWAVSGIAGYMCDLYGKALFGNNAYRWQQKQAAERIRDIDADRPSIYEHGKLLKLDPSIREFMDLKSALVLFILDRRLLKAGSAGCARIINKIFLSAKTSENGELSTAEFQRISEKYSHGKLETFFKQWVYGAGCPIFYVQQRFNKKKLVVEMTISQRQIDRKTKPPFAPNNFMREIKEHVGQVWAGEVQPVFTGPMTIRIHEADGTPYEHIVEIKEMTTKLEIPYNTKYKRLKRSRRQKERAAMAVDNTQSTGEGEEGGALLYCLGDILDSDEEAKLWNLVDWSVEEEEKMGQESYEWIRMDADFEWIGNIHLVMPLYMYISQLQQDRDVVAQYESMRWLLGTNPHHISLSICLRTLMDRRYFHGIRTMAAEGLAIVGARSTQPPFNGMETPIARIAQFHLEKAFEELFCFPGEIMPRPNDFSDRATYIIQCAIPTAMAQLRDHDGKVPMAIRKFFVDKLKFNDNSENAYSDCHYVATLMRCLADSLVVSHREVVLSYSFNFGDDEEPEIPENPDEPFEREAIDEIERYRRIDEWISTYHNTYSITALECLQKLTKAGLVKDKTKEILQYTRPSNADLVRLQAFRCLAETGVAKSMMTMRYLLKSIADDPSPYFRNGLLAIFGEALGHLALGDAEPAPPQTQQADPEGLVIEQEASSEQRHLEATRKTSPEGAVAALKLALANEPLFKEALWYAATSDLLTLDEIAGFCDVADLIFDAVASCRITLKLPKMWTAVNLGKGKVAFNQRMPYRIKPLTPLPREDHSELLALGLKYSGPVELAPPVPVKRRQSSVESEDMPLAARVQQGSMLPPAPVPASGMATPISESIPKFTLKLGGPSQKRQASADLGAPSTYRAGSPKSQKISRQQTPSGYAASSPKGRSPSVASQRRGSTPGPGARGNVSSKKKNGSKIVILPLGIAGMRKALEIQAKPSKPGGAKPIPKTEASRSLTPVLAQTQQTQPQSSLFPSSVLQSPTAAGSNYFTASPMQPSPTMNLGGFRSYGSVPDASAASSVEIKQEVGTPGLFSPSSGTMVGGTTPAPLSVSPPAAVQGAMAPPPRPKIKLKASKPSTPTGSAGPS
ncbi:transcription initiation factor tfIID [Teratosphaeria destructans]|uniref:Transcription initiation factor TFIID subunit 2 n=1 Tax=Teratosphaeria destructans TaxID=418781 RepID=A0A9W7SPA6_9PEZI|nr:transcription initiation factor tfIID [Teratosphaeria destructans]